jgi:ATP-dependent HslUV protease ATP-binding subunit HslU
MIGSTGVGKTEIARRLAKMVKAPFIKVEATKFTEVGYVGRDVESIIRDLAETSVRMVRSSRLEEVQEKAAEMAEERILDVMVPQPKKSVVNPFGQLFGSSNDEEAEGNSDEEPKQYQAGREWCRKKLLAGEYEDKMIEIDIEDNNKPMVGMFAGSSLEGMGDNIQDIIGSMMPKKHKKRKVTVEAARKLFQQEEAMKLVDMEEVTEEAVKVAETSGIVFLDEIDICLFYLVKIFFCEVWIYFVPEFIRFMSKIFCVFWIFEFIAVNGIKGISQKRKL